MVKKHQNFPEFLIYLRTLLGQLLQKTFEPKNPKTEENVRDRFMSFYCWQNVVLIKLVRSWFMVHSHGKTYCFY